MTRATATIESGTPKARRGSGALENEKNNNFVFLGNANFSRKPEFFVKIFNVREREQKVDRPWVNPGRQGSTIIIPEREPTARYSKPFLISDVVQMPEQRAGDFQFSSRGVDGKFLAQDALNPEEPTGSWKTVRPVGAASLQNEGTNLYHWGCWWTIELEPTDAEVEKAVERLEATYRRLIAEAEIFAVSGPDGVKQIGNTHREAANYFELSFTWNTFFKKQSSCPNCGRAIPNSASRCFHDGCKFVISWERALQQGTATLEEAERAGVLAGQAQAFAATPPKKRKARQPRA